MREISFISYFVPDDRLAVEFPEFSGSLGSLVVVAALAAAMRDPWFGIIVEDFAIMDGPQMTITVGCCQDSGHLFPVIHR